MTSSQSEKAILGILFMFPEFIPVVRLNEAGLFHGEEAKRTWEKLSELQLAGDPTNIAAISDLLWGQVRADWLASTMEGGIFTMGREQAEAFLFETMRFIKDQRKRTKLVEWVNRATTLNEIDHREILQICSEAELKEHEKEDPSFGQVIKDYCEWKEAKRTGISTGFPSFDNITDNFNYGELVAIMARTSVGKTFAALNMLDHMVSAGVQGLGFFSMEMAKAAIGERIMQLHYGLHRKELADRYGTIDFDTSEVSVRYRNVKVYGKVYGVDAVSRIVERDKLKVIFLDYLQLMKSDGGQSIYEKVTYKMHALKALAKNQGIVIFLLVQLSRRGEGGWEPVTIDMARDSGAIEENSDFIIGLWNPSLKEGSSEKYKGRIFMKLLKNKRGPNVGIECAFNPATGKLYEAVDEFTQSA